ncbi:hypothetical protein [Geobacillus sp. TFV-3]|uniref:hypothetical protein n=1 Tax=Geobacillus sp. TFV-3 TaxID=1897059 RepID=UPI001F2A3C49|nr:hypothetical protein [Geobacillus sp. TFV-3]KAF0995479.1 hypothetical protein BJQ97_02140 [Geobacillus sp. TFV-3]
MTLSQLRRQARQALKGKWGMAVLIMLVYFVLNTVIPTVLEMVLSGGWSGWMAQEDPPFAAQLVSLLYTVALLPLGIAVYWVFLDAYRGQPLSVAVYRQGKLPLKLIGASILYGIFVFL